MLKSKRLNDLDPQSLAASIWANPYKITEKLPREEVIRLYEMHIRNSSLLKQISTLDGKTLGCFCESSEACHADVLIRLFGESLGFS